MRAFFTWFNNLYPIWLVGLATVAFLRPETMRWFDSPWIFGALAASMLSMGLSLPGSATRVDEKMPGPQGGLQWFGVKPLELWSRTFVVSCNSVRTRASTVDALECTAT